MFCTQTLCSEYFATIPLKFTPRMLYKIKKKKEKREREIKEEKKTQYKCFIHNDSLERVFRYGFGHRLNFRRICAYIFVVRYFSRRGKKKRKKGGEKKEKREKILRVCVNRVSFVDGALSS